MNTVGLMCPPIEPRSDLPFSSSEPGGSVVAQRGVGRDRDDVALGDQGVGGERGLAEEGGADRSNSSIDSSAPASQATAAWIFTR
jgi:hypothetical protein